MLAQALTSTATDRNPAQTYDATGALLCQAATYANKTIINMSFYNFYGSLSTLNVHKIPVQKSYYRDKLQLCRIEKVVTQSWPSVTCFTRSMKQHFDRLKLVVLDLRST